MSSEQKSDAADATNNDATFAAALAAEDELDTDDVPSMPRREFTAEERAAQAAAQAAEDAEMKRDAAALEREQKQLSAAIKARPVKFVLQPSSAASALAAASGGEVDDDSVTDYNRHDSRLQRLLFVEADGCACTAPMAAALVRKFQAHVLSAAVACASGEAAAALDPLAVTAMADTAVALSANHRHSLTALPARGDARFHFVITLDDASKAALDALATPLQGAPQRIHQPFRKPQTAAEAEELRADIKTFVQELPELLSMMA